jgi:hypothetical protein
MSPCLIGRIQVAQTDYHFNCSGLPVVVLAYHREKFMRRNLMSFTIYFPDQWGYHRQGSCQAGLGADISKVCKSNVQFSPPDDFQCSKCGCTKGNSICCERWLHSARLKWSIVCIKNSLFTFHPKRRGRSILLFNWVINKSPLERTMRSLALM